ncbi:hypothetical protein G9C98_000445 [Cotesia typhae]|uniref:Uncharacterized protein n=1 Tax=Cotesia typhae TaxID=2053667 RepID=A0A8J5QUU3_9HYME|nr:hypothetical protein G9C98_000445 [Cotesia typhae]
MDLCKLIYKMVQLKSNSLG